VDLDAEFIAHNARGHMSTNMYQNVIGCMASLLLHGLIQEFGLTKLSDDRPSARCCLMLQDWHPTFETSLL
jgi:hypothetical protein